MAQGFSQIEGIDFEEMFSGVVDKVSIRTVLHYIASMGMECLKFDVPTAFLNAELEEEIFVTLPPQVFQNSENMVYKLKKALYGLKQSPRAWQKALASSLKEINFVPLGKDPCVFVIVEDGKLKAILGTHVDDGLLGAVDIRKKNLICHFFGDARV